MRAGWQPCGGDSLDENRGDVWRSLVVLGGGDAGIGLEDDATSGIFGCTRTVANEEASPLAFIQRAQN